MNKPLLRLEDLHVGMIVSYKQLSNIYDTYITLINVKDIDDDWVGEIAFIGKDRNDKSNIRAGQAKSICAIFHPSVDELDGVSYDY